jgi:hypothetical protein
MESTPLLPLPEGMLIDQIEIEIDPFLRRTRTFGLTHQLFIDDLRFPQFCGGVKA